MRTKELLFLTSTLISAAFLGPACGGGDSTNRRDDGTGASTGDAGSLNGSGSATGSGSTAGSGSAKGTGGSSGSGSSAGTGATAGTGGVVIDCTPAGDDCSTGSDCCSNICDGTSCVADLGTCSQEATPCNDASECCSLACVKGVCSGTQCVADGASCDVDGECCGGICTSGKCADVNGGTSICKSAGNGCDADGDCCSKLCGDSKTCLLGSSYCAQLYDRCTSDSQCCQGTCTIGAGESVGYCSVQATTGTGCTNKKLAGEVCDGNCTDCCSRACAPYGSSGKRICQPPSGCKPEGEICQTDLDCCGGDPDAALPGAGNAQCNVPDGETVGRCKVTSCSPQGDICKYPVNVGSPSPTEEAYVSFCGSGSTASNACCSYLGNGSNCSLDALNIPRCDAITDCRPAGEACASSGDCCGGLPCVQNDEGHFICYDPPGDGTCVVGGGPCTNDGDCCVGSLCIRAPGESTGTCGITDPPDGTGGAPGTGGSGMGGSTSTGGSGGTTSCAAYGQACETGDDCCNAVPCDGTLKICRYSVGG